jgi:hypothetical protein
MNSVVGGGGFDTVHVGGTLAYVDGVSAVDVLTPLPTGAVTSVMVMGLAETSSFDLRGGDHTELAFDLPYTYPADLSFSNTGIPGSIAFHGIDTLNLIQGVTSVYFDGTVLNGGTMRVNIFDGETTQFDASREAGRLEIFTFQGSNSTVIGTASDTLNFAGGMVELDRFSGSGMSGVILDIANPSRGPRLQFSDLGGLIGNGNYQSAWLDITDASGISTVDLQAGEISGTGGTASVANFGRIANLTSISLDIRGGTGPETLVAGSGGDTLTGGGFLDRLIGGAGPDHFVYLAASDSTFGTSDLIDNFHDSGPNTSVLDVAAVSVIPQHFTGYKGAFPGFPGFSVFAADQPGDVSYFTMSGGTIVHVASGAGYSSNDLIIQLQGVHALTGANFHLHP